MPYFCGDRSLSSRCNRCDCCWLDWLSRFESGRGRASAGSALALLPVNVLEPRGLAGEAYTLVFTPGLIASVYGSRVAADLLDEGGYVDLEADGRWWIPAGRTFYSPDAADPPAEELASARRHLLRRELPGRGMVLPCERRRQATRRASWTGYAPATPPPSRSW